MIWKPKEKELTPEEAVERAKKELSPYWFGSPPLLAAVRMGPDKVSAFPLEASFGKQSWLMFFIDPTDFSGDVMIQCAREFHRRYHTHQLGFLIIYRPQYSYMRGRDSLEQIKIRHQLPFPIVVDADETLLAAFGATTLPKILLFTEGKTLLQAEGPSWMADFEIEIQKFLRSRDPGLPLLPEMEAQPTFFKDVSRLDFGRDRGAAFPKPGFSTQVKGFWVGNFPDIGKTKPEVGQVILSGNWIQDGDRIATQDSKARLDFVSPGSGVSIVAQALPPAEDLGKIVVEVEGIPAYDAFCGGDLGFDDEGSSTLRPEKPQLYHLLESLPSKNRWVTLRFPHAGQGAVAIYGLRFSEPWS